MKHFIYIINAGDHDVEMPVKRRIKESRLKGVAQKFLKDLYGPEIYRGGDIVSVKLKEET